MKALKTIALCLLVASYTHVKNFYLSA